MPAAAGIMVTPLPGAVPQLPSELQPPGPPLPRRLHGIMWLDLGRRILKRVDDGMLEEDVLYFVNPLIYRVEIDPVATVLGFQRNRSGVSIEVDGHEDCHWNNVLQELRVHHIRSSVPAPVRDLPVPPGVLQPDEAGLSVGRQDASVRRWGLDVPGAWCLSDTRLQACRQMSGGWSRASCFCWVAFSWA